MKVGVAQRPQRRERVGETGDDRLEHPLGAGQVLQAMLAHVAQLHAVGSVVTKQADRGARQQHLSAVSDRFETRDPVDRRTE